MKTEEKIIADEFGPEYVVEVNSLKPKFKGFLIIDNLALGVGKGGIRMAANLTLGELFRLARTMTWKNSLFELPFGGAKAGIVVDPRKLSLKEKKEIIQAFAKLLSPFIPKYYIAGPDIGTGEQEMKWFSQALGIWNSATGKPKDFCFCVAKKCNCGLPHELGSTGFGVAEAAKVAAELSNLDLKGATVAVAGFGNVGSFAAKHLSEAGAKIVAVSEAEGAIFNKDGLDLNKIISAKKRKKPLAGCGKAMARDKIYELPVDILIPAAVSDVVNEKNYQKVRARIIVEGANIPIPEKIENKLWQKGIVIVPDFVANGGGVISSFVEWQGKSPEFMFKTVEEKIRKATRDVLRESLKRKRNPRDIALVLAKERIIKTLTHNSLKNI